MPSHSFIITKTEHLYHLLFFIVVSAWLLQRVKLGTGCERLQHVLLSFLPFFFYLLFWSRLSDAGTVSLGNRLARKSGTAVETSANCLAVAFEFVGETYSSSDTFEQFFFKGNAVYTSNSIHFRLFLKRVTILHGTLSYICARRF